MLRVLTAPTMPHMRNSGVRLGCADHKRDDVKLTCNIVATLKSCFVVAFVCNLISYLRDL
jgi:hypothetical protein